ncbi:hypothetical protein QBC40DRAFT_285272 [Triangularia verruculosa]|uniref:3'-5' exonuclease domain-containing protein n=1 Tax=Triangularia verruculosa TaxID=2587418 RepID=A0AAN6XCI7_9PEZI|nr:hypothetical protein QBC40DRAFT_285272 [Triangularia verruculosa]
MSSPSHPRLVSTVSIVASISALETFLDTVNGSSSLYLDLEGTRLGRDGTLELITVLVYPQRKISIIDVHALGNTAFTTAARSTIFKTLKIILETPVIPKYLWDVRNDADALKALYNVSISGVIDIQLLENVTRPGNKLHVKSLENAIRQDAKLADGEIAAWKRTKTGIRNQMNRRDRKLFSERPLTGRILQYCVGDVQYLPDLRKTYMKRPAYTDVWVRKLEEESSKRVMEAWSPEYNRRKESMKLGPWGAYPKQYDANGRHLIHISEMEFDKWEGFRLYPWPDGGFEGWFELPGDEFP